MKKTFYYLPVFLIVSANAFAGAYQLNHEYNAVSLGDAGAGGAALASDASTLLFNPAGIVRLPNQQLVLSAVDVTPSIHFSGTNTWSSPIFPSYTQTGTAQGGSSRVLPALYYSLPLTERWRFGISVTGPFGLGTYYGNNSVLRYSDTKSELKVIDLSPNLVYAFNRHFSIGAGVDFNRVDVTIKAMAGIPSISAPPNTLDALSNNWVRGWGYGWHAGILYQLDPGTRFGLGYRSRFNANLNGNSSLDGGLVTTLYGLNHLYLGNTKSNFIFPSSAILSAYHDFTPRLSMDASVYYTHWQDIKKVQTVSNIVGVPPVTAYSASFMQHYRNTWMFALGAGFRINEHWLLRGGLGYDQSPVKSSERNVYIPDGNRFITSIGGRFTYNKQVSVDAGWSHFFVPNVSVNNAVVIGPQSSTSVGNFSNFLNLYGAQLNWNLDA